MPGLVSVSPTPSTDRTLSTTELYLCDSGAQYRDGTTDVTRTVHFGVPTDQEKVVCSVLTTWEHIHCIYCTLYGHAHPSLQEAFTLVLKGHIDLCQLVFPNKTHGRCVMTWY